VLATRTTAEWIEAFTKADIPVAMMHSLDDILSDEHLKAIGYFKTTHHPSKDRSGKLQFQPSGRCLSQYQCVMRHGGAAHCGSSAEKPD